MECLLPGQAVRHDSNSEKPGSSRVKLQFSTDSLDVEKGILASKKSNEKVVENCGSLGMRL
jgi:hypothetical protein